MTPLRTYYINCNQTIPLGNNNTSDSSFLHQLLRFSLIKAEKINQKQEYCEEIKRMSHLKSVFDIIQKCRLMVRQYSLECLDVAYERVLQFISIFLKWSQLANTIINIMQEDIQSTQERTIRVTLSNFNAKHIQNWDDFRKTFKPVKFEATLNTATNQQLHAFWHPQLLELTNEIQRICILAPSRVAKLEQTDQSDKKVQPNQEQPKKASKNGQKQRGKDQKPTNEVPLEYKVVQFAMELIRSSFPQLDYDYASLFLGNDKQLLIYRRCFSIQKYIEKYRLPKNFEAPFDELTKIAKQFYELKILRNRAFSTFDSKQLQKAGKMAQVSYQKMNERLSNFKLLFRSILEDYLSKPKCKELVLINVAQQLIDPLKVFCQQNQTQIINRFNECDNDQFKDIIVVKMDDPRLKPFDIRDYEDKVEYIYVDPERVPEPPKDIRDITFLKISLQKQCYLYRIDLPSSGKYNPLQGIFIRSQQGDQSYELNINIQEGCKEIEVEIYPYRYAKSVYQIYTWNQYGFTKSTEKIVLFNQMPLPPAAAPKLKNKRIYFLGETQFGLYPQRSETVDELMPFAYQQKEYTAKGLAMGNSVIICDALGDVAGWGEMYCPEEERPKEEKPTVVVQEMLQANLRVETPCLLLSGKQIRKISCGNGYCLMTSIFGAVFSMGYNQFGQLGLGHSKGGEENMSASQICKFTNSASPFVVDVHATVCGASFAITQAGHAYRWGYNQVDNTQFPIYDRFNSVINYAASPIFYKECYPAIITKQHIPGSVKWIQAGCNFFMALDVQGNLYGWGECKYLGVVDLKDRDEKVVFDIINPIQVMKNIDSIAVGFDHCVAITKDGRVLGWGNCTAFSNKIQGFIITPVDVTQQYGGKENCKLIRAGRNYTVILTVKDQIKIIGQSKTFKQEKYTAEFSITDIQCSYQNFIGVLGQPK